MNSERERESHKKTVNGNTRGGQGLAGDEKVLSLSSSCCFLFFKNSNGVRDIEEGQSSKSLRSCARHVI